VWRSRLSDGHAIQCNAKQTCSDVFYLVWRSRLSDGHAIQCKANQTCSNVFYAHKLAWQHEVAAQHDPVRVGSASWTLYDRRKKCRLRYSAAGRFICPFCRHGGTSPGTSRAPVRASTPPRAGCVGCCGR
jgi:hypothetical protein